MQPQINTTVLDLNKTPLAARVVGGRCRGVVAVSGGHRRPSARTHAPVRRCSFLYRRNIRCVGDSSGRHWRRTSAHHIDSYYHCYYSQLLFIRLLSMSIAGYVGPVPEGLLNKSMGTAEAIVALHGPHLTASKHWRRLRTKL